MGVPAINEEKLEAFSAIVGKINQIGYKTRTRQLLKVREACGGCWAARKSRDKLEYSREKNRRRENWAKHEVGGFEWKI